MINDLSQQKKPILQNSPTPSWQTQLANAISSIDELLEILNLSDILDKRLIYQPNRFKLRVPRAFIAKMQIGDINDPLLRQILPNSLEQARVSGFTYDPLSENLQNPDKGILHKYRSRILLTITGACAIHCRYCFRQHFDYASNLPTQADLDKIIKYVLQYPDVNEVIFSGGDPLSLSNRRLFFWFDKLRELPQIDTIRLHTRLPIVLPDRLDDELLAYFSQAKTQNKKKCQFVMVTHCNHANEIDDITAQKLQQLKNTGVTLLNQAVLLAGINDNLTDQVNLCRRLWQANVLPYYLHLLDKVAGAAHFDLPEKTAIDLYWQMLECLPGYLMPKLVQELPDKPFKTPVNIYKYLPT